MLHYNIDEEQTPVMKCRVVEIEDPIKERVIESQAEIIHMVRVQVGAFLKSSISTHTLN